MSLEFLKSLLIWIAAASVSGLTLRYLIVLWFRKKEVESINKLEARIAVLRTMLKAKLKKKYNIIQKKYKKEKELLEELHGKLELLCSLSFQSNDDYTKMTNTLYEISTHIDSYYHRLYPSAYISNLKEEATKPNSQNPEQKTELSDLGKFKDLAGYEKWSILIKFDKANMYILKEIVDTLNELKNRIEAYNEEEEDKKFHMIIPKIIEVENYDSFKIMTEHDQKHLLDSQLSKSKNASVLDAAEAHEQADAA